MLLYRNEHNIVNFVYISIFTNKVIIKNLSPNFSASMFYDLKAFSFPRLFMSMKWRYHCLYRRAFEAAYEQIYVQAVFQHIGSSIGCVFSFSSAVQVVAMDKGMLSCLSVSMKGRGGQREAVLGQPYKCLHRCKGTKQRTWTMQISPRAY